MNMKACNDNILVYAPVVKQVTKGGIDIGAEAYKKLRDEANKQVPFEIHSVGQTVQDKSLEVGKLVHINGQLTVIASYGKCDREGYELASVKAYSVVAVQENEG